MNNSKVARTGDKIYYEFTKEEKLTLNYDINYEGIKRKFSNFFNLIKIHMLILFKTAELEYQKMNLYLYKIWLKQEYKYAKKGN
jgi:hypothetical protein